MSPECNSSMDRQGHSRSGVFNIARKPRDQQRSWQSGSEVTTVCVEVLQVMGVNTTGDQEDESEGPMICIHVCE